MRAFKAEAVDATLLRSLLEAARWAPSPHNSQPWRFVVITSQKTKEDLAKAMGKAFRRDLRREGASLETIENKIRNSYQRITQAPAVIVVCFTPEGLKNYPDPRRQKAERIMGLNSLGAAIQNILLSAYSLGLGTCWMGSPLFCQNAIRHIMQLEPNWEPQALVLVGKPAEFPSPPHRLDIDSLAIYR